MWRRCRCTSRASGGACWLALALWERLDLDRFWGPRLPPSRQGTRWLDILKIQACYRLIDPGSEWRLHRHWYEHSALRDLLGSDRAIADDTLYRCLDKLLAHKQDFFSFLHGRWAALFDARFDVLLYDLTSTYFATWRLSWSGSCPCARRLANTPQRRSNPSPRARMSISATGSRRQTPRPWRRCFGGPTLMPCSTRPWPWPMGGMPTSARIRRSGTC